MAELKPPTTYDQQLDILRSRGVSAVDTEACKRILERVNYYRLTAYLLPFKQADGNYEPGTDFMRAYRIYEFDRKLRRILFSAIETIEIYLRAEFSYFHAHKYGAEGYMDPANFSSRHDAQRFKETIEREIRNNSASLFVKHHEQVYGGRFPFWVAVELFTFGMLSFFYSDLFPQDQKYLSKRLYSTVPQNVISWLRCCTDLRNICAHYGRLYYRVFSAVPAHLGLSSKQERSLWGAVLAVKALYPDAAQWGNEILPALARLFDEYRSDIDLHHIAFPSDWLNQLCMTDHVPGTHENVKMVEVQVELPSWLDAQAAAYGLDLSKVLQDALKERLGAV